jgi:tRNA modification GTPase
MIYSNEDTIAAIATGAGEAAIGVIRISGPIAKKIAEKLFEFAGELKPRLATLATVLGQVGEPVLITWFNAPYSYNGDEVIEISAHGGRVGLQRILQAVLAFGARHAERGEFTRRAFLAGKLDLAQAEAVCDLISAHSPVALAASERQLHGLLTGEIENLRQLVVNLLAQIEARLDFPDEEIADLSHGFVMIEIDAIMKKASALAATYRRGRALREGIRVAIIGRPNVGKSSLFNRLLEEDRAIVTDEPGTTRDLLEEVVAIDGVPFCFIDTAGLRRAKGQAENAGVSRARDAAASAEVLVVVFDGGSSMIDEDLPLLEYGAGNSLAVINKSDLPQRIERDKIEAQFEKVIDTCALSGSGVQKLASHLLDLSLPGEGVDPEGPTINRLRHADALNRAIAAWGRVTEAYELGGEIAATELRESLDALGEITGETLPDEILDKIFGEFCIGK